MQGNGFCRPRLREPKTHATVMKVQMRKFPVQMPTKELPILRYEERTHQSAPLQNWLRAVQKVMAMMTYEGKTLQTFDYLPPAHPTHTSRINTLPGRACLLTRLGTGDL